MVEKKHCKLCKAKVVHVDYKNIKMIKQFTDRFGRIKARYYTGTCLRHQKQLAHAIKNARFMDLMPYVK